MKKGFLQIGLCSLMMVSASFTVSAKQTPVQAVTSITTEGVAGNNKKEDVTKGETTSNVTVANFKKMNSIGGGNSSGGSAGNAKKSD